jgi:GT2 family glycosyltransferase
MNGSRPDVAPLERLEDLTGALESERSRLRKARYDYAIVDRSRFARLRSTWFLFKHALGLGGARDQFAAVSRPELAFLTAAASPASGEAAPAPAASRDAALPVHAPVADPYERWRAANDPRPADLERMREIAAALAYRPLISIIMPTYETPEPLLLDAIRSVRDQVYPHWELCIADDASPSPHVRRILDDAAARDHRIRVVYRSENGHISRASNSALAIARGEFVALLDHDDLLSPDALFENVVLLNRHPNADMIYSDEDKCDESGRRRDPFFKPDWSPETFLSKMYTCHFGVYRRSIVERIGGFRAEFDGSQDYDLVLRFTEHTDRIHPIARVLYHWRIHAASAAGGTAAKPYAYVAAQKALTEALARRGEPAEVQHVPGYPGHYVPRFEIVAPGRVAIIVPTRDRSELLDRALRSIVNVTTYRDWEIVVVDDGSAEEATRQLLVAYEAELGARFRVVRIDEPFNFSRLVNAGVAATAAPYVVLLNNDTEIVTPDWLEAMVEQCQRPQIGAVGVKLVYPDGRLQHGGVILGLGGVAGHGHYGEPAGSPGYYGALVCLNNYSAVTAACMMVRRAAYLEVGGFDEELVIAYNDVDFCLKLGAAGYRNVYLPHVTVLHVESASRGSDLSASNEPRNLMEQAIVLTRWGPSIQRDPYFSPHLSLRHSSYTIATS